MILLLVELSTVHVSCDTFYIVPSQSSPCPGEYIGVPCLTLQQYASNPPSQSQNIIFLIESGMYNLSTVLSVSDRYNFTMSSTDATVTCTSDTARFELSRIKNVHVSGINFQGCKNTAIKISRVNYTNIVNSSCLNNQALYGSSRGGGCLEVLSSSVNISDSVFRGNKAYYGGVISAAASNLTVDRSEFTHNSVHKVGGAIYCSGRLHVSNTIFANNSPHQYTYDSGGAIYATGITVVTRCQFINHTRSDNGGALYASGSRLVKTNSTFLNNVATWSGGAIYVSLSSYSYSTSTDSILLHITECLVLNNTARRGNGGAIRIYVWRQGISTNSSIAQCQFINNIAGG